MSNTSRKVILAMQMTFDGYVAGPNDEMDWIIDGNEDWDLIFNDLQNVDTIMTGGKMYPGYAEYWRSMLGNASADPNLVKFAELADRTPHIVFSKTLQKVDWANTRIARDAKSEIASLKQQPGKNMVAWGGATFAANLIREGLVDEYRIALNPTILGKGKALFNNMKERQKLSLIDARPLPSGIIVIRYRSNSH